MAGPVGPAGPAGPAGMGEFAEFFALAPPNNATTVAIGGAVDFPQDGPNSGTITSPGVDSFNLPSIGTYRVSFSVPVDEPGQLVLAINGIPLAYTVVGRATGTSAIAGESLVTTTTVNSLLSVMNSSSASALTVTPIAGGVSPVSSSLIIQRLN